MNDLFKQTRKVIAEYEKQALVLTEREQKLNLELDKLQQQQVQILLDKDNSFEVSDRIYFTRMAKDTNSEIEVIHSMLEEIAEERTALNLRFTPVFKDAIQKDRVANTGRYDATKIVEKYRYQMLAEIAEKGQEMNKQYQEVAPSIFKVFNDPTVKENFPRLEYAFNRDQYNVPFGWFGDSVVSKNDVFTACYGNLPNGISKPEEGK